jgi:hypothetical protein
MGAVWREIAYTARSAMCQLASNGIEGCLRRLGVIDLWENRPKGRSSVVTGVSPPGESHALQERAVIAGVRTRVSGVGGLGSARVWPAASRGHSRPASPRR